jgi:cytidine deaminase
MKTAELSPENIKKLMASAREVYRHSYTPYSLFPVGACLLAVDEDGSETFVKGCNVENASFGLAICAERVALTKAVSEGHRHFKAIAIAAQKMQPCFPCGTCLQFIREFGADILVILEKADGSAQVIPIAEMLPYTFTGEDLRRLDENPEV